MAKVTGSDLEFWYYGSEIPIISADFGSDYDTLNTTDTSTADGGKEFILGKSARKISIETNYYSSAGNEIATGPLVAGTKYIVTLGTITEGSKTYAVGRIFVSAGTGTASSSNKVRPWGEVMNGKGSTLSISGSTVNFVDMTYSVNYDELDVTDSSSSGELKEMMASRGERELTFSAIQQDTVADLMTASTPSAAAVIITWKSGFTVTGSAIVYSKKITDETEGIAKVEYKYKFIGVPTETWEPIEMATTRACELILKRGASTNHKRYAFNAYCTSKEMKTSINSTVTASYNLSLSSITEHVLS